MISTMILFFFATIGWISSANDDTFVRLILGDGYVNITEANIEDEDPLAIYKSSKEVTMFLGITFNNIMVSFYAFLLGLAFSWGTVYLLMSNGIMLGAFHYMFYKHGLFFEAIQTIWIHGTLEISAIAFAGATGIMLGNSFMFPGTFTRYESFVRKGKEAFKMLFGLIPIFIIAGLLESFVTRHYQFNAIINFSIIALSLGFVIWYYFIYPHKLLKEAIDGKY